MAVTWITPIEITLTTSGSWADVDLSSYIASGTTGVLLHVVPSSNCNFGYRKNGSTDNRTSYLLSGGSHQWVSCGVDANRILELYVQDITYIDVYLVGYFDSSAVFNTNATDISLSTTGSWADIDINVDDSAIGAIIEVVENVNFQSFGLRKNGSTDNRYQYTYKRATAFIGLDENEICEGFISGTGVDFFLTGYIKSGATFNTNATDLSLSTTGAYTDLTALPSGATGGFIETINNSTTATYALRKNGSSEDIYKYLIRHHWAAVECDTSQIIEGKIASTDVDFFLTGYTTGTAPSYSKIKIRSGSNWINPTAVKTWNGSAWAEPSLIKIRSGSEWVTIT